MKMIKNFLRDESGASAAEYALILAIVGTGIAVAAFGLGNAITGALDDSTECIQGVTMQDLDGDDTTPDVPAC
ncbi:Flp family type IVb pilin [Altererythrobacter sp. CAU 1778]